MRTRLTATVCLAAGLLLLTSCRTDPKVAAYVGSTPITEAQISQLVDEYNAKAAEVSKNTGQTVGQATREDAVFVWTGRELCDRLSKQKGFSYQAEPVPDNVPALVRLNEDRTACWGALPLSGLTANEQDMRELYQRLTDAGATAEPFETVKEELEARVKVNNALLGADKLTLNPRYNAVNFVGMPIAPGAFVVTNRPAQPQLQAPAQQ